MSDDPDFCDERWQTTDGKWHFCYLDDPGHPGKHQCHCGEEK